MLQLSAYGRIGKDPVSRETKTGKDMATVNLAVDVTPHDSEQETLWLGVVAFGKQAETLLRHKQGDLISIQGKATQSRWTDKTDKSHVRLSVVADSIVSARTVRPGGRRSNKAPTVEMQSMQKLSGKNYDFDQSLGGI